jgi:hypothetical protein
MPVIDEGARVRFTVDGLAVCDRPGGETLIGMRVKYGDEGIVWCPRAERDGWHWVKFGDVFVPASEDWLEVLSNGENTPGMSLSELADSLGTTIFRLIAFAPDLIPRDLTGCVMLDERTVTAIRETWPADGAA